MKDDDNGIWKFIVPAGTNRIYTAEVTLNPSENFGEAWTFIIPNDKTIYTGLDYQFYQTASSGETGETDYSADKLIIQLNLPSDWTFCLPDCFIGNKSKGPTLQIRKANENHLWLEVNNPHLNDSSATNSSNNNFLYGLRFLVSNLIDGKQNFYLSTDPQVTVTKI